MNTELIAKYLAGECAEEERAQIESWLSQSDLNRQTFEGMKQVWEASSQSSSIKTDTAKQWEHFSRAVPKQSRKIPMWLKYAAVLIPIGMLMGYLFFQKDETNTDVLVLNDQDQALQLFLPDSTEVWLRSGASLHYPKAFSEESREIELEGEAYFSVVSDVSRPFTVSVGEAEIQVLGTEFNIKERENLEVSVFEGKVSVSEKSVPQNHKILVRNESAIFSTESREIQKLASINPNDIAWKTGVLSFENTPLLEVCRYLENYYGIPIHLNNQVATCPITTVFDNIPLEDCLEILASTLSLETERKSDTIELSGNCH